MSDLDGTDPNIHGGTVEGVMRERCNAFLRRRGPRPTVPEMMRIYRRTSAQVADVVRDAGSASVFEARIFEDLCFLAKVNSELA
jgi:hypothetical protein